MKQNDENVLVKVLFVADYFDYLQLCCYIIRSDSHRSMFIFFSLLANFNFPDQAANKADTTTLNTKKRS